MTTTRSVNPNPNDGDRAVQPANVGTIRAWKVCDEDTVAAATAEEAIAWYARETGIDRADLFDPPDEVDLSRKLRRDEETNERITYAQAIAECTSFPCVLATTEY